jgi:hypothetical protein
LSGGLKAASLLHGELDDFRSVTREQAIQGLEEARAPFAHTTAPGLLLDDIDAASAQKGRILGLPCWLSWAEEAGPEKGCSVA